MKRKVLIGLSVVICFSFLLPVKGYSSIPERLMEIVSPERKAELSSYPVEIIVQLHRRARLDTFTAGLNGRNITDRFEPTDLDDFLSGCKERA